ncbi:MAG: glycosyltransferase, partial [Cytophagales bacterium]|nr:glycosyltransferase [Cytophagales bacterium]
QLESLVSQSVRPAQIWVLQNENNVDIRPTVEKYRLILPDILIIRSDFNFKYFGRFSVCSHVETEFVFVVDDDVIPSAHWLQICLDKCVAYNAIISCTGRIIPPFDFRPEACGQSEKKRYFIGDNYNEDEMNVVPGDTRVDYGCNSYFFRKEWLQYFWSIWPCTFASGEDIHLAASLMVTRSIPTIVPEQTGRENSGNLKKYYSQDPVSSWRSPDFIDIRQSVFRFFIEEKKWKPILWPAERVPA